MDNATNECDKIYASFLEKLKQVNNDFMSTKEKEMSIFEDEVQMYQDMIKQEKELVTDITSTLDSAVTKISTKGDLIADINGAVKLINCYNKLDNKLTSIKDVFGESAEPMMEQILNSYEEVFQLKIVDIVRYPNSEIVQLTIVFKDDGKLLSEFPIIIDLDLKVKKIYDIQTNFYPHPEKLKQWAQAQSDISIVFNNIHKLLNEFQKCIQSV